MRRYVGSVGGQWVLLQLVPPWRQRVDYYKDKIQSNFQQYILNGLSITADVGGNFSVESLQDIKTYVGAISAKDHGYIDFEKKKLKGKAGLAKEFCGSIGVVVEENEDRKKDCKN